MDSSQQKKTAGPTPAASMQLKKPALLLLSVACFPLRDRESAETNQGSPIPFPEGGSDAVHGCINRSIRLRLADFACACNLVNEIGFIHFFSYAGFFRSQRSTGSKR